MRHEQRKYLRFPVDGQAMLFAAQLESAICCHMIDLGLEGCRLRRGDDEPLQVGMTVEIAFRLAGTLFRFPGTIQWSAKNTILGLYFTKMSDSHKNELADLLGAMHEEMEAREKESRDKATQEKIDIVKQRLIRTYGYNDSSATDVLQFVASIFARGHTKK